MSRINFSFLIGFIIFAGYPLIYWRDILYSHDEFFIINTALSLPLNNFIAPISYYGPSQFYLLVAVYSILSLFGITAGISPADYIKILYANNFESILLVSKILSFVFFIGAILTLLGIYNNFIRNTSYKKTTFSFLLILITLILSPVILTIATSVKVESFLFFLVSAFVFFYLKWRKYGEKKFLIITVIICGIMTSAKYNMIIVLSAPIMALIIDFKTKPLVEILKNLAVTLSLFCITFLILTPAVIFKTSDFVKDISYIFEAVKFGHLGFEEKIGLKENIIFAFKIIFSTIPWVVMLLGLAGIFFSFGKNKNENIPLAIYLGIFVLFVIKWNFKLSHYFVPAIPVIFYFIMLIAERLNTKYLIGIIILMICVHHTNINLFITQTKNTVKSENRIKIKNYISSYIPAESRIMLEDMYYYSPMLIPASSPIEYSTRSNNKPRLKLKAEYFKMLSDYGKSRKFRLTFLNVPLEGELLDSFVFPDENYLLENIDYVIVSKNLSSRFRIIPADTLFFKTGNNFYFNVLNKFESKQFGNLILYKIK